MNITKGIYFPDEIQFTMLQLILGNLLQGNGRSVTLTTLFNLFDVMMAQFFCIQYRKHTNFFTIIECSELNL